MKPLTDEQLAAAARNRLRAESAERRLPRLGTLRKYVPPDLGEQLYRLGFTRQTGSAHMAVFDGLYRVEVTGLIDGREVRVSATAERGEDLFPNLLRAFG